MERLATLMLHHMQTVANQKEDRIEVPLRNNIRISIGNECMFSWNVAFHCTDQHAIPDRDGKLLNRSHSIDIGNHVWLAADVSVLKNAYIADGCIVGAHCGVAKRFEKPNCMIVGNPPRGAKTSLVVLSAGWV